ncbi:ADP-ribosylation factor-like protein 6-interacting protein 4 [Convolutriloba macropyga]|uniref:ADP-ribosylation factor-like protein 6-interacting protein 4 n=1 Tax=Convolutriloba macropyga TaxID=536237 RepID=UPI003F51C3C6
MTASEYAPEKERVREVYEPETGRVRLVKGDGEVVEKIVSREEQERIRKTATMTSTSAQRRRCCKRENGPAKSKFPSQHPWFGYG